MKKRILIIDNDKLLNKINEKVLGSSGIVDELHFVSNGLQAIEYLHARIDRNYPLPDIIVLDLHMPVMDGFAFLDEFHKLDAHQKSKIEIVIFTASSSPKDMQKLQAKGVKNYLNKPYLLRGLTEIINRSKYERINR